MITHYKLYGPGKKCSKYDEYFKEYFLDIIEYPWVRENYNKPLDKLRELVNSSDKESREYIRLNPVLSKIKSSRIKTLFDLFDLISTKEKASHFSTKHQLEPD
jgi:hypothetical protein